MAATFCCCSTSERAIELPDFRPQTNETDHANQSRWFALENLSRLFRAYDHANQHHVDSRWKWFSFRASTTQIRYALEVVHCRSTNRANNVPSEQTSWHNNQPQEQEEQPATHRIINLESKMNHSFIELWSSQMIFEQQNMYVVPWLVVVSNALSLLSKEITKYLCNNQPHEELSCIVNCLLLFCH